MLLATLIMTQVFAFVSSAYVPISPMLDYLQSAHSNLSISGSTATCTSLAQGYLTVTKKIKIDQYLEKKSGNSWTTIASWSTTIDSYSGSVTNYLKNLTSGTYRLKTVFTINGSEVITKYSLEVTK